MKNAYNWHNLVTHLLANRDAAQFEDWQINRILGGANGLLYHVENAHEAMAVKFCKPSRDRHRALCEYVAMTAIERANLKLAPRVLWMDESRYKLPVVVETWEDGEVSVDAPLSPEPLLAFFCALHSITPENVQIPIYHETTLSSYSAEQTLTHIAYQKARVPRAHRSASLNKLLRDVDAYPFPTWANPPIVLAHGDNNLLNFLRRPDGWLAVDWEYSGWNDPAHEIAEMMAAPNARGISAEFWQTLIAAYQSQMQDTTFSVRVNCYYKITLAWWCVRFARYLYEKPRGKDLRPANNTFDMQETQSKYDWYLNAYYTTK